jgi:TetR/AcrR family hemagglutinin/protease transcriptional regulator
LACALKVFANHGLGEANHAAVAAEAHTSVPTVFVYFKTREKLIDAVLTEVENLVGSTFENAMHEAGPADEVLLHLSQKMVTALETHPFHVRIFHDWSIATRANVWSRFLKLDRRLLNVISKLIKRGQREGNIRPDVVPEDEAQILHAASRLISQMKLAGAKRSRIERFQQSMFKTMLLPPSRVTGKSKSRK